MRERDGAEKEKMKKDETMLINRNGSYQFAPRSPWNKSDFALGHVNLNVSHCASPCIPRYSVNDEIGHITKRKGVF